jgi:hypothetical protein
VDVWRFKQRLSLAIEGDWGYEKASSIGVLGGAIRSFYKQHQGNLGVSLRYGLGGLHPALAWISPHVRCFASLAATSQRLVDASSDTVYRMPYETTGGGGVALGVTLRSPSLLPLEHSKLLAISLGVRFEAGYGFMADPELRLQAADRGDHPIEVRGASLGSLQLDAAFLRASLELRL